MGNAMKMLIEQAGKGTAPRVSVRKIALALAQSRVTVLRDLNFWRERVEFWQGRVESSPNSPVAPAALASARREVEKAQAANFALICAVGEIAASSRAFALEMNKLYVHKTADDTAIRSGV